MFCNIGKNKKRNEEKENSCLKNKDCTATCEFVAMETVPSRNLDVASVNVMVTKTLHGILQRKSHVNDGLENQCEKIGKKRSYSEKCAKTESLSHDIDEDEDGMEMMRMKFKKIKKENVIERPTSLSFNPIVPVKTQLVCSTCKMKFTSKKNFNRHQVIHSGSFKANKSRRDENQKELSSLFKTALAVKKTKEYPKPPTNSFIIWEDDPREIPANLSENSLLPHQKQKGFKKCVSNFNIENKENLYPHYSNNIINYVCSVCHKHFLNLDLCLCHQQQQHSNIEYSYLEVEQGSNIADLHYPIPNQVGILGRSILDFSICKNIKEYKVYRKYKCTKCSRIFYSVPRLHSHIIECGAKLPGFTDNNCQYNDLMNDLQNNMVRQE